MDPKLARIIEGIKDFEHLETFEENARARNQFTTDIEHAVNQRRSEIGRAFVAERTGIDLNTLTPAEEGIVRAVGEYVGLKKRDGTNAGRTIEQIKKIGLIAAAEASVMKSKPTQGFERLETENLKELSYEQIIVDNPAEFSARALWFARKTLGHPNDGEKPPAHNISATQRWTEKLIDWLKARADAGNYSLGTYTNADAAAAIGIGDMTRFGRVFGNVQSRIDFACYKLRLPPLGLAATAPFAEAWGKGERSWSFPVQSMRSAAQEFEWHPDILDRILSETERLPAGAYALWVGELKDNADAVRSWAFNLENGPRRIEVTSTLPKSEPTHMTRNPDWTREEHILALELYFERYGTGYDEKHPAIISLSRELLALAAIRGMVENEKFRNPSGVSMKMMNFRRLDPKYTVDGKVGLSHANRSEESVWEEFASDREALSKAAAEIRLFIASGVTSEALPDSNLDAHVVPGGGLYWVFVCNPERWAIDRFLESGTVYNTWSVRKSDADRFAPGQLGVVRVGVDRRSKAERAGRPPLVSGIYALLQVESKAYPGTSTHDEYWAKGTEREPGWPTIRVRYLQSYRNNPLTIDRLRANQPEIDPLILNGLQASTFPIQAEDFEILMSELGEDIDHLPLPAPEPPSTLDRLAEMEEMYMHASPQVKARVSKAIERGPIGNEVKKANGYKCQLCEALGHDPLGFKKRISGLHYVEAHHVMPVSTKRTGVLSASNIMTLCANHHRLMHYGTVEVVSGEAEFSITLDGLTHSIPKTLIPSKIK